MHHRDPRIAHVLVGWEAGDKLAGFGGEGPGCLLNLFLKRDHFLWRGCATAPIGRRLESLMHFVHFRPSQLRIVREQARRTLRFLGHGGQATKEERVCDQDDKELSQHA